MKEASDLGLERYLQQIGSRSGRSMMKGSFGYFERSEVLVRLIPLLCAVLAWIRFMTHKSILVPKS